LESSAPINKPTTYTLKRRKGKIFRRRGKNVDSNMVNSQKTATNACQTVQVAGGRVEDQGHREYRNPSLQPQTRLLSHEPGQNRNLPKRIFSIWLKTLCIGEKRREQGSASGGEEGGRETIKKGGRVVDELLKGRKESDSVKSMIGEEIESEGVTRISVPRISHVLDKGKRESLFTLAGEMRVRESVG